MSLRVAVFRVIGLAGCASAGYGIHGLVSGAACTASVTECPLSEGSGGGFVAPLVVGILAAVVGVIGGGFVVFGALFAGIGLGAVVAGLQAPSGEFGRAFGLLFGGMFTVVGLLVVAGVVWGSVAGRRRALLLRTGVRAVGVVVDVQDTGVSINDNPSVRLTLDITPSDESPPFRTTLTHVVSRVRVPRPGDRLAVVLDPADRSHVVLDDTAGQVPPVPLPPPPPLPPTAPGGALDELERLARLHASGALTDEEFARWKGQLLG